jgi:hypothetical protein
MGCVMLRTRLEKKLDDLPLEQEQNGKHKG